MLNLPNVQAALRKASGKGSQLEENKHQSVPANMAQPRNTGAGFMTSMNSVNAVPTQKRTVAALTSQLAAALNKKKKKNNSDSDSDSDSSDDSSDSSDDSDSDSS